MQSVGRKWVNRAIELQEKFQGLNFDLPNMHLLIETLLHAVPALQCMIFASGGRYESNHLNNKIISGLCVRITEVMVKCLQRSSVRP